MRDGETRRFELKSRMLNCEINRLTEQGRELALSYGKVKASNQKTENCWAQLLQNTVKAYRASHPELRQQILKSKLATLASTRESVTKGKSEEKVLANTLQNLSLARRAKEFQLSHCHKQHAFKLKHQNEHLDQALIHELASTRIALKASDESALQVPTDSDFSVCGVPGPVMPQLEQGPFQIVQSISQGCRSELPGCIEEPRDRKTDSAQMQRRWQDESSSHQQRLSLNEKLQVSILKTSLGESLHVDYQLAPGRMLSVEGKNSPNTASIALTLGASKREDRMTLSKSTHSILLELRKQGLEISKVRVVK